MDFIYYSCMRNLVELGNQSIENDKVNDGKDNKAHNNLSSRLKAAGNITIHFFQNMKTATTQTMKRVIAKAKYIRNVWNINTSASQKTDGKGKSSIEARSESDSDKIKSSFKDVEAFIEQGKDDPAFVNQTFDAMLASIYKDAQMKYELTLKKAPPYSFLKIIGEIAYNNGADCKLVEEEVNQPRYVPKGFGANPLLTNVLSNIKKNYSELSDRPSVNKTVKAMLAEIIDRNFIRQGEYLSLAEYTEKMMAAVPAPVDKPEQQVSDTGKSAPGA